MKIGPVKWRVECFELIGEKWLSTFDLGLADIDEIKAQIRPDDEQEMCGSYRLSREMVEWLSIRFNKNELLNLEGELFLERDS